MPQQFLAYNGHMQTTAAPSKVALTSGTIQTLLQLAPLVPMDLVEWGISFDGSAAGTPGTVEIIETDVAATVTAFVSADITRVTHPSDPTALSTYLTLSTSGSGFTASAEGSITTVRNLDFPGLTAPTTQIIKQLPLGSYPYLQPGKFFRIRVNVTFTGSLNALCYAKFQI